jgi:hypothetical protein
MLKQTLPLINMQFPFHKEQILPQRHLNSKNGLNSAIFNVKSAVMLLYAVGFLYLNLTLDRRGVA